MFKKTFTAVLAVIVILGGSYFYFTAQQADEVYIEQIIDGDTVKTAAGDSIRLLGVDTPEINWENNRAEFYGKEARDFTLKNLLDKNVLLEFDQEKEDHYGRTLAYIYLDGDNFNQKLLEEGYAVLMIVDPNDKYEAEFKSAVEKARRDQKGIWAQVLQAENSYPLISYQKAEEFIGQQVVVKGKIVNTAAAESINYLNFSDDYHNTLSLVIFNRNLNKFAYQPAEYIKDKEIKVFGKIELYEGSPQIVVDDPHDILIID